MLNYGSTCRTALISDHRQLSPSPRHLLKISPYRIPSLRIVGPGAAQVIPHVHFHIIPRPPLDYQPPKAPAQSSKSNTANPASSRSPYAQSAIPTGLKASFVQFGRGQRNELDDDDAAVLVKTIRENIKVEWERAFGPAGKVSARSSEEPRREPNPGTTMRMVAKL